MCLRLSLFVCVLAYRGEVSIWGSPGFRGKVLLWGRAMIQEEVETLVGGIIFTGIKFYQNTPIAMRLNFTGNHRQRYLANIMLDKATIMLS